MTKKQTPPLPDFPRTNYHVVKIGKRWYLKVGGEVIDSKPAQRDIVRPLRIHCTQMWRVCRVPSEIWLHGKDGQVRQKDSYGLDPPETEG